MDSMLYNQILSGIEWFLQSEDRTGVNIENSSDKMMDTSSTDLGTSIEIPESTKKIYMAALLVSFIAFMILALVLIWLAQSGVLGHFFAACLKSESQLAVLQVTVPGLPCPSAMPHSAEHSVGSPLIQLPDTRM